MAIRAVLFDVGGPIDTEVLHEQHVDRFILRAVREAGFEPSAEEFEAASADAVACFAPNTYATMIWLLCGSLRATSLYGATPRADSMAKYSTPSKKTMRKTISKRSKN